MRELRIKDICDKGSSNLKQKDVENGKGKYPVYGASGISGYIDTYHQEKEYISIVKDGSGIGRVSFMPARSSVIGTLQYILPKEGYNIKYISYCLQSLNLSEYKQGAAIPHIYFRDYGEFVVKVEENIAEQERIVALLDDQFAKIDALKANADQQLKAAKALFQSALKEMLTPKEGWVEKKLGEICKKAQNIKWSNDSGIKRYIDLTSVSRESLSIIDSVEIDYTNAPSRAKQIIKEGDILFATTRPTLRRVCRVSEDFNDQICSTGFCVLRSASEIDFNFLFYNLLTDSFYSYIEPLQTGASYPAVTDSLVKAYPISFPSLPEQERIAARLDAISEKVKALQANYDQTITLCNDLKQALLKSIFA